MIRQFKGYDEIKVRSERVELPRGGYVMRILHADEVQTQYGPAIEMALDVAEGQYVDFYRKDYNAQQPKEGKKKFWRCNYRLYIPRDDGSEEDDKTKNKFKAFMNRVEDSNEGYKWNWDEDMLAGKLIGCIVNMREKESNGQKYLNSNIAFTTTVDKIRSGQFNVPEDKLLSVNSASSVPAPECAPVEDVELPF